MSNFIKVGPLLKKKIKAETHWQHGGP